MKMNWTTRRNNPRGWIKWTATLVFAACSLGAVLADMAGAAVVFYKSGTNAVEDFSAVTPNYSFDVVNSGTSYMMLVFESNVNASVSSNVVRIDPGARTTVSMTAASGAASFSLAYDIAYASTPFKSNANSYRAYNDGETEMIVPVSPTLYSSMQTRAANIFDGSKTTTTTGIQIYTPGPAYASAGLFARDFLYQLEGGGRDTRHGDEVRNAVDYLASKQLTANRNVGAYTYPKGAIPDHVYPDGRYAWGPGLYYGDVTGPFQPPVDGRGHVFRHAGLALRLQGRLGRRVADVVQGERADGSQNAWNSVPRNPKTGLVTQWTTPGHVGANGIAETTGPCVMWGFHDSYGFAGDDLGTSVLACNAARALADMYDHASDTASAKTWSATADAMRDAIRAQFNPDGYLPWGVGTGAPTMASPDITGYAVWSGILTDAQADAASDWFAAMLQRRQGGGRRGRPVPHDSRPSRLRPHGAQSRRSPIPARMSGRTSPRRIGRTWPTATMPIRTAAIGTT